MISESLEDKEGYERKEEERKIYWDSDKGLGVEIEEKRPGKWLTCVVNYDTALYGVPNPRGEIMAERWIEITEDKTLLALLSDLTNNARTYENRAVEKIFGIVWPHWYGED